jgi:cytochrome P450
MALQRYGSWWRRHRKAFHQHFNGQVVAKYHPHQLNEAHAFLRRLLDTPENFLHHVRQ